MICKLHMHINDMQIRASCHFLKLARTLFIFINITYSIEFGSILVIVTV